MSTNRKQRDSLHRGKPTGYQRAIFPGSTETVDDVDADVIAPAAPGLFVTIILVLDPEEHNFIVETSPVAAWSLHKDSICGWEVVPIGTFSLIGSHLILLHRSDGPLLSMDGTTYDSIEQARAHALELLDDAPETGPGTQYTKPH